MKNLFRCLLVSICLSSCCSTAFGWGMKGHDIVAAIAANNLKPGVAKKMNRILDGHTLMYYSSWMDFIRKDEPYQYTATWHYANIDAGETYESMPKNPTGDVLTALNEIISKLRSGTLSDSMQTLYVKFLIHLVGDIHCPMHTGHLSDLGANKISVTWFGKPTNLHAVWDDMLVESAKKWSYTEWVDNIDILDRKRKQQLATGTPADWLIETHAVCEKIYEDTPEDSELSYQYMFDNYPVVEQQLLRAGLRLADILNSIYK